jgi:hypothetical protein
MFSYPYYRMMYKKSEKGYCYKVDTNGSHTRVSSEEYVKHMSKPKPKSKAKSTQKQGGLPTVHTVAVDRGVYTPSNDPRIHVTILENDDQTHVTYYDPTHNPVINYHYNSARQFWPKHKYDHIDNIGEIRILLQNEWYKYLHNRIAEADGTYRLTSAIKPPLHLVTNLPPMSRRVESANTPTPSKRKKLEFRS